MVGSSRGRILRLLAPLLLLVGAHCSGEPLSGSIEECKQDTECDLGDLCHKGACVAPSRLDCVPVGEDRPVIEVSPTALDFGDVSADTVTRSLNIDNRGQCTLSIVAARFEQGASSRFSR